MINEKTEPMFVPVCPECGGYIRHSFRIGVWECCDCGATFGNDSDVNELNKFCNRDVH